MAQPPIKDDNLRLILSKDHDAWLNRQIRDRVKAVALIALACVMSLALIVYVFGGAPADEANVIYVSERATQEEIELYERDGYDVVVMADDALPAGGGEQEAEATWFIDVLTLVAFTILLTGPLFAIKALLEIRRYRLWRTDHEAFLRHHNRLP